MRAPRTRKTPQTPAEAVVQVREYVTLLERTTSAAMALVAERGGHVASALRLNVDAELNDRATDALAFQEHYVGIRRELDLMLQRAEAGDLRDGLKGLELAAAACAEALSEASANAGWSYPPELAAPIERLTTLVRVQGKAPTRP